MPHDPVAAAARRILVVEDHDLISLLMSDMLEEMGHSVCAIAPSEEAAIAAAADHQPDLIIADAALAGGSGLVAMAVMLRARWVPHIYMSGNLRSLDALPRDAVVLRKPFKHDDLAHAISQAVQVPPMPAIRISA